MCSLFTVWASARSFPHFFVFLLCVPSTFVPCTFIPCTLFPAYSFVPRTFVPLIFVHRISVHVTIPAYSFLVHLFSDICSRNIFLLRIRLLNIFSPHLRSLHIRSPIFVPVTFSPVYRLLHICSPHTPTLHICSPHKYFASYLPQLVSCTLFPARFFPALFPSLNAQN